MVPTVVDVCSSSCSPLNVLEAIEVCVVVMFVSGSCEMGVVADKDGRDCLWEAQNRKLQEHTGESTSLSTCAAFVPSPDLNEHRLTALLGGIY